ncbi:MAG: hypothetical protein LJE61_03280 [Thiocapsa sp.]|nr:hypothetical protein [Thiocapsa sp.]MCG6896556.1 hypothetical protein [Thiocapsa sp.]MCG6984213.1 hypothetical protein [Thiocapsa sp.]
MIERRGDPGWRQGFSAELGERKRLRTCLARLEADIAYFQARLEMIGEPTTSNQLAQRKAFKQLLETVSAEALQLKREHPDVW